jgi:O-antigen ligase
MGRMLTTRALQPPVRKPAAPLPAKSPVGPVAGPPAPPAGFAAQQDAQQTSTVKTLSFYFGLAFIFVVFGVVPELMYYVTGINTYLIYFVAPAAIVGAVINGGLRRTFQSRTAWYWVAFFVWLVIGIPFSYWKGGSYGAIYDYSRVCMPILFVVGGLASNWKEIRAVFYTIGMAGLVNLLSARIFAKEENGRLNMDASGTIGNSNDLAAHLIIVLPFILFISMDKKRNPFLRLAMIPLLGYGVSVILGTASRGGLIALAAVFVFMILRATPKQRVLALAAAVVLAAVSFAVLPSAALSRLGSLFGGQHEEAEESGESRSYLFWTSMDYTLQHPVFGVGLGQFANFEGKTRVAEGKLGNWHATHCSWTQVSSECGIPALLFFVLGIGSALLTVHRIWRKARAQGLTDISNACFCYLIAMIGFLIAITFLANAYRFYFPAMVGLAISMNFVASRQMSSKTTRDGRLAGMAPLQPAAVR